MRVHRTWNLSGIYLGGALLLSTLLAGCPQPLKIDYHTQVITAGSNELGGKLLHFRPDGSLSFYSRQVIQGVENFIVDPETGEEVDFEDADPFEVPLPDGKEILFYGRLYDSMYIGSDGVISLGDPGEGNSDLTRHFRTPQVSALRVNAAEGNGTVTYEILQNEIVVSFSNVIVGTASTSFQVEFFIAGAEDGDLALSYPQVGNSVATLTGLSNLPALLKQVFQVVLSGTVGLND
jgi:hypothetical protein